MEKITLTTSDHLKLSALWADAGASKTAILLHMMPATKESWQPLGNRLIAMGLNVLAPDFRGHGESEGGDYKNFSAGDHQQYLQDAEAARAFVEEKHPGGQIVMAGASIGANITIQYLTLHPEVKKAGALSAGLDYYGVKAEELVQKLSAEQTVLLVAACDDVRSNGLSCDTQADDLFAKAVSKKERITYEHGGHGTDLFASHPELVDTLANFLAN